MGDSGAKSTDSLPNVSATVPPPKQLNKADGIFGNFGQDDDSVTLTSGASTVSDSGAKSTDSLPNESAAVPPPKQLKKSTVSSATSVRTMTASRSRRVRRRFRTRAP